jgi:multiple sugar transport system permease protein
MLLGFLIAMLLNRTTHLSGLYLTLIFIPWTIADLLAGVIIRLLVQPDYGLLTGILQNPSLFPPHGLSFLTDTRPPPWIDGFPFPPAPAMVLLILVATWRALPFVTLLMLAALQTVPSEILESGKIDGANEFQIARLILIPLMLPTMVVALSNLILTGMNGVGTVFSLTRGGPGSSTDVLSYMLYTTGWRELNFGRAASLALMIAAINLLLITGTLRLTRVEERSRQDA